MDVQYIFNDGMHQVGCVKAQGERRESPLWRWTPGLLGSCLVEGHRCQKLRSRRGPSRRFRHPFVATISGKHGLVQLGC